MKQFLKLLLLLGTPFSLAWAQQPLQLSITSPSPKYYTLAWLTDSLSLYQMESSTDLVNWAVLGTQVAGTGAPSSVTDGPVSDFRKFYRLRSHGVFPGFAPALVVRSGFEPNVSLYNYNGSTSILGIQGVDQSVPPPNDWTQASLDPNIGDFYFQLASPGTTSDRNALITADPLNPANHVVAFLIHHATEPGSPNKGRISYNIGENNGLHEIYYKVKLFLPTDIGYLQDYPFPPGNWLTLMEFFQNPDWTTPAPYPFRITLYVVNSPDRKSLTFAIQAQTMDPGNWQNIWTVHNTDFNLPFNEWLDMEVYYKEGGASSGRFFLAVTRANHLKTVLCDVTNYTYHPNNPSPSGLKYIYPMKLYCSQGVVDWVATHQPQNGTLQVYWDDLEFWKNK